MKIDGNFVKGVAYYLGDGRMAAPRSLSTANQNVETIKFFIRWLKKYFNIKMRNIKIKIKVSNPNFNEREILLDYSKKLGIKKEFIHSVSLKDKLKPHHKTILDIWANNSHAKRYFDSLIPIIKEKCLKNKKLALEYLRGIMAAEGSPKYDKKSGSRNIHLKMKNENEIRYIGKLLNELLNIKSSVLKVRTEEGMWLVTISGFYELKKLNELDIFEIESEKRKRFRKICESYKRAQVKKGEVSRFYIEKLALFNNKFNRKLSAPELSKLIKRDRTRTINVLRQLEKKGLVKSQRRTTLGTAFEFWVKD